MSATLEKVQALAVRGEVRVSLHGYEELAADQVRVHDIIDGVATAVVMEDYPDYAKGPCVLVLPRDGANQPIHVVWGIPAGQDTPAVDRISYEPDRTRVFKASGYPTMREYLDHRKRAGPFPLLTGVAAVAGIVGSVVGEKIQNRAA